MLNSKGLKIEDTDDQDNNGFVETSEDYPNENKPGLFILRESATITCVLAETQRQAEDWKALIEKKGEGFRYSLIGGWCGEFRRNILCDWRGVHIWLSLHGRGCKLEGGAKIRKAIRGKN